MLLLGLDIETSDCPHERDPENRTAIIEVGAVLYDWKKKTPVEIMNFLVRPYHKRFKLNRFVKDLTGITDQMLKDHGHDIKEVLATLAKLARKADYMVGHNGREFDQMMIEKESKRFNIDFPEKIMIDTLKDIHYPDTCKYKNLTYLAGYHGIIAGQHRALFDVFTMMNLLALYDVKKIISKMESSKKLIKAERGRDRELLKSFGFNWNRSKRRWEKEIFSWEYQRLKKNLPFRIKMA
ncbi:MAG: hypothetical protein C0601_10070 [Candidatus Muiribacterium halophilum]|uniref:Exonuclease domain-containing protein n=1 Tax=Muiribacterium halophilum TaxID=2053465 RepID=A0A2N5ZCZ6_MUIH1|nr:MAG: hypothetical protein C0601_10070 [Candidatus Muirbacterium halophilum]